MSNSIEFVVLRDSEETHSPVEMPVLKVAVVRDEVFLIVEKMDERHSTCSSETISSISVNKRDLLGAIALLETPSDA